MTTFQLSKSLSKLPNTQRIKILQILIGCVGIAYLGWKFVVFLGFDIDFKYIWLAGDMWGDGESPYGLQYQQKGRHLFDEFNDNPFYYPPNWWPFSVFFGHFDFHFAADLWRSINVILLITSSFLLRAGMQNVGINLTWAYLIFYTGLVSLMQAAWITLMLGQTSILLYFSVCLIIYAVLCQKQFWLVVGFCLILLKPQMGLALVSAFLPFKVYRAPLIYASVITAIITLPALLPFGIIETITSFLDGLSKYGVDAANNPQSSTGLRNIFHLITNIDLSGMLVTLLAILGVLTATILLKKHGLSIVSQVKSDEAIITLMLIICILGLLAPLHPQDLIFVAPIILLAAKFGGTFQWIISIIFLFIMRAENIALATGFYNPGAPYSFGGLVITFSISCMLFLIAIKAKKMTEKS